MATKSSVSKADAARFLLRAQFSAPAADIAAIQSKGYDAWLGARFEEPRGQKGVDWLTSRGHNAITKEARYF